MFSVLLKQYRKTYEVMRSFNFPYLSKITPKSWFKNTKDNNIFKTNT